MVIADGGVKPGLFASTEAYVDGFEVALRRVLGEPSLGAFILVLANASFDAARYRRFRVDLDRAMDRWSDAFDRGLQEAQDAPADDVEVFRQLRDIGLDALDVTQWRDLGPWRLQFNALRALRPPRMSDAVVDHLLRPFDPRAFHFNKPFLRPEILWEGRWGRPMRLLFNKFPFAPGHGLLVPEPEQALPQYLDPDRLQLLWDLTLDAGAHLPGIGFGYNALGAYASVNHLHFQLFVDSADAAYPVELPQWCHNGGAVDYPLPVTCFDDPDAAWRRIDALQQADHAFNLLVRPGRLFAIERARQGSYRHSAWTGGFAWSEVAGSITLFERERFESLDEAEVMTEFGRLRAPG
jgi:diadenosine tetraphosphate (Ap4A) HIT family hydrolase